MLLLTKTFAALFSLSYFLVVFVWPSFRTYRRTGVNPLTFGSSDSTHDFVGKWFKLVLTLIPLTITIYLSSPHLYQFLLPAAFLERPIIQGWGMAFCSLALIWTAVAQWQMGTSWRIGIDEVHKTELRTSGLFSLSRNPVFLGMLAALLGLFMLLPNALTLLCLVAGYLLLQIQIRLEEEALLRQHSITYENYKSRVRRLF